MKSLSSCAASRIPSLALVLFLLAALTVESLPAQTLSTNIVRGTIATPGARNVYTFNLTQPTRFAFDALTNLSTVFWSLDGPPGPIVDKRAFSVSDGSYSDVLSLDPGFYRLTISGLNAETNAYVFRLQDLATGTPIAPGTPVVNVLNPANETRIYQWTSAAGDRLFFDRQSATPGQSIWWRLIDPYDNVVFDTAFSDVTVTQRVAGTYTLLVEGYPANDSPVTNTFVVQFQGNTPPTPFAGAPLPLGAIAAGTLTNASTNAYVIAIAAPVRIMLDSLTNSPGVTWSLEGPPGLLANNRALNGADWNAGTGAILNLVPGDYQLRVRRTSAGISPYRLRLVDVAAATPIALGVPVTGALPDTTALALYQFDVVAGAPCYIDFQTTNGPGNAFWELFTPLGQALASAYLTTDRGPLTLPHTGRYLLAIEGFYGDDPGARAYRFNMAPIANTIDALPIGPVVSGSIDTPGQSRQYLFSLAASTPLAFDSRAGGSLRWSLAGPEGGIVSLRRFNTADSTLSPLLLSAGDYSLTVSGNGDDLGAFAFRLIDLTAAPALTTGLAANGSINPSAETDAYRFTGVAGAEVYFDVLSSSGLPSASWRCFDPFWNELFNGGLGDRGPTTLTVDGTYTLLIEGHPSDPAGGTYTINVSPVHDIETPLTLGEAMAGALGEPGQSWVFAWSQPESTRICFDSLTNSPLRWSLDRPAGRLINARAFSASDATLPTLQLAAGDYRLTVTGAGDATGGFRFLLRELTDAAPLNPGTPVSGTLNPPNKTDLYRFTATPGTRVFFDLINGTGLANASWRCFDPFGTEIAGSFLSDLGPIELSAGGLYTLAIVGGHADPNPGAYTINVVPVIDPVAPLTVGAVTSGAITVPAQTVRHPFTLASPAWLYLDSRISTPLRATLSGPLGTVFANRRFDSSDTSFEPIRLVPGQYELAVSGVGDETGSYEFRLFDLASAAALTPGTPIGGTLSPANETDAYRFSAAGGDRFFFDWISRTGTPNARWRLFDPLGNTVFATSFNGDLGTNRLLLTGTYTLLIEGYIADTGSGAYQFNVVPLGNIPIAPFAGTPFAPGDVVSGTLPTATTTNSHPFTLAAPGRLIFDSLANTEATWTLLNASATLVNLRSLASSDSADANPVLDLSAGSYQINVRGVPGPYSFRLIPATSAAAFTPGEIVTNSLSPARGTALWKFSAQAGDRFYFDGMPRSGFSTEAYSRILPPGGPPLGTAVGITTDIEPFVAPVSGDYLLTVEGRITDAAPTGNYSFLLQPVLDETNTLAPGAVAVGAIAHAGQQQHFTFSLGAPARLFFDGLAEPDVAGSLNWSLHGPGGVLVNERSFWTSDSLDGFSQLNLPAGDYRLTVNGTGNIVAEFAFRLIDSSAALPLTPGTTVDSALIPGQSTVLYRFRANAGDKFYFDGRPRPGTAAYPSTRIITPLGADLSGGFRVNNDYGPFITPLSGDYLLPVEGRYTESAPGGYTFVLHRVLDQTNTLSLGATIAGALEIPGQTQSYQFALAEPHQIYFDTLSDSSLQCTIAGPAGIAFDRPLWTSDSVDGNPVLDLVAGSYTVMVSGNGAATGTYAFRLLDAATALPFTPGTLVTNSITPGAGTALWSFDATAGDRFYFDGRPQNGFTATPFVRIMSPVGTPLFTPSQVTADIEPFTMPRTGRYLLSVEGRPNDSSPRGNYSFALVPSLSRPPTPLFETNVAPDLVVASLALTPSSGLQSGQPVSVAWTTRNDGSTAATGSFQERVLIRQSSSGQVLATRILTYDEAVAGPILPGAGRSRQATLTLPDGPTGAGALEVTVLTDASNLLFEQNPAGTAEANNSATLPVTSTLAPYPDLEIASLTFTPPAGWPAGSSVTATWVVTNSGNRATAGPWTESVAVRNTRTDHIVASESIDDDPAAPGPGGNPLGALAPGGVRTRSLTFTMPAEPNPDAVGLFEVTVTADRDNQIFEHNTANTGEFNNTRSVTSRTAPDLVVQGLTATASPAARAGADLVIRWTLLNQGNAPVSAVFYDRLVIRNTNTSETLFNFALPYNPAAPALGAIPAGGTRARTNTVRLPDGLTAVGSLEITLTTDAFDQLTEENPAGTAKTNNQARLQLQISPAPYPDLIVTSLSLPATGRPGEGVPLIWTVRNVGSVPATGPWTDQLFLSSDSLAGNDQFLASAFFSGSLAPGQSLTRTQQVTLPAFGTGNRFAVAEADASAVLFEENEANNTAVAAAPIVIPATLTLTLTPASIPENAGAQAVLATLTRNSDAASVLVVSLNHTAASRLQAPASITLPAGASSASFFIAALNDSIVNGSATSVFTATAPGHAPATNTLTISEDDTPALTLRLAAASAAENGAPIIATITRNAETNSTLALTLFTDRPDALTLPAIIAIPAGQTNVTFALTPVNDTVVTGPRTITIHASAQGYPGASAQLDLIDDDTVALSLQLAENSVAENKLNPATTAVLSRSPVSAAPQRVRLRSTAGARLQVPDEIIIPAGQPAVSFAINVVDDRLAEGSQSVDLIAEGLTERGAAIPGPDATARASLTILENDGPALFLQTAAGVISEGASTTLSITRNTPATNVLLITLAASPASQVTLPATITLAAGQTSTNVIVTGGADGVTDGVQEITLTATTPGYSAGRALLSVTDINVPDLAVHEVSAPTNVLTDASLTVIWTVTNSGLAAASGIWIDEVSLARDAQGNSATLLASVTNAGPILIGESYSVARTFAAPAEPGTYWLLVRTDVRHDLAEGSERNNDRVSAPLIVQPSYRAAVETEIDAAVSGTPIPLSGRTYFTADGSPAPFRTATVRVSVKQTRRTFSVFSDANGRFSGVFRPIPGEAGLYTIGADHPRVATDLVQDQFTLLGLAGVPWELNLRLAPNSPLAGQIEVRNLSPLPLTGLTVAPEGLPLDFNLTTSFTNQLAGNATNILAYVLSTTLSTPVSGRFTLAITSLEGATTRIPIDFTVTPPGARLVAAPGTLAAGMLRGTQTLVPFEVSNEGGAPSGDLQVTLPVIPWLSLISASPIPSIPPGGRASVLLALNAPADLPLGRYDGTMVVQGGTGANLGQGAANVTVPFQFRALSEARGDVRLTVTDEHTYYAAGAPRVTNALVTLRDPFTGDIVTNATSDAQGEITLRDLPEGTYQIEASAPRHSPARGGVRVNAGVIAEQEVFLLRQEVTYEWSVVPSVIPDHYRVVLEPQFETEVPQPNLVVENPEIVPLVFAGQTSQFAIRLRNTGLISLLRVRIPVPNSPNYIITPLVTEIEELPAQTTVSVPVTIRTRPSSPAGGASARAASEVGFSPAAAPPSCPGDDCVIAIPIDTRFRCGRNFVTRTAQVTLHAVCVPDTGCDFSSFLDTSSPTFFDDSLLSHRAEWDCLMGSMDGCNKARIRGYLRSGDFGSVHFPPGALPAPLDGTNFGLSAYCACGPQSMTNTLFMFGTNYLNSLGFPNSGGSGSTFSFVAATVPGPCNAPAPGGLGGGGGGGSGTAGGHPGVCARVRLELSQDITMTRAAFRGTLQLENGGATDLTGIQLAIDFRDANGQPATDRFAVRGPTLTGITSIDGQGRLPAGLNGVADFLFIPTLDAAPSAPAAYQIGGTLRFTMDGQALTVPLLPGQITVLPDARLELEYFQQRDVFSDDPFTPVLEPAEPFALGLRVSNRGAGPARNFQIASAAPRITENEKGLLVDFQLLGAHVDDRPFSPSFNVNVGDINPAQARTVIWDLTSSLQGKFIDYRASFTHVDAFGATNLSLIDRVSVHELIHVVQDDRPGADAIQDFLVNDQPDPDNFPDTLYLSSGSNAPVALGTNPTVTGVVSASTPAVELMAQMPTGWSYLRLPDPGPGLRLVSARRSDGRLLRSPANAWTTDRTFPSSIPGARREHTLHLLDYDSPGRYTLTYATSPLDTNAPASVVVALPAASPARFVVEWNGTDNPGGSGLAHFDVYVSINGGPFTNWLARTTQHSALFDGVLGNTYAFYSRATDAAGNTEIIPATADAQTTASTVNTAPSLLPIANVTLDEGATLNLQPVALDTDLPRQSLSYTLAVAPPGATYDSTANSLRWTTTELDGNTTNRFTLIVADNGQPSLSVTQSFNVIVRELNAAPVFTDAPTDLFVDEESLLSMVVAATDPDRPAQTLTWQLEPGAPVGVSIAPATGQLTWLPGEARGPGEYLVTVTVRDNGSPTRSASRTLRLIVREVNRPPVLAPIATQTALVQTTLVVTNSASDPDIPTQQFFYSLAPGAPRGARIDRASGLFTWTPIAEYARTTNAITVQVTDNGVPSMTGTRMFTVIVGDLLQVQLGRGAVASSQTGSIAIVIESTVPATRATFIFEVTDARLGAFALEPALPPLGTATLDPLGNNRYRVRLDTLPGQVVAGSQAVSRLRFTAAPGQPSAFVALPISDVTAVQANAQPVPRTLGRPGRVAYVGPQPLLELDPPRSPTPAPLDLRLYGRPNVPYTIETTPRLVSPISWSPFWSGSVSNLVQIVPVDATNSAAWFRARGQ